MAKAKAVAAAAAPSPAKPAGKAKKVKSTEPKEKRPPSAYNLFMKSELAKVKKAQPTLDHKQAFTAAANNWKNSKENPANKK